PRTSRGVQMGLNVVTPMFDAETPNHGYEHMPVHQERYERDEEFVEAVLGLWYSWSDKAFHYDRGGVFADPDLVRPINHQGRHFQVDGPLNVPRPLQGNPVLFQAGSSEQGRPLPALAAGAIYSLPYDLPTA